MQGQTEWHTQVKAHAGWGHFPARVSVGYDETINNNERRIYFYFVIWLLIVDKILY